MDTSETVFLPSDRDASGRSLGEEELLLLREVIEGGNLFCVPGNMVPRFERAFAEMFGVPHARAVTSGTAAVHTALGALDIARALLDGPLETAQGRLELGLRGARPAELLPQVEAGRPAECCTDAARH